LDFGGIASGDAMFLNGQHWTVPADGGSASHVFTTISRLPLIIRIWFSAFLFVISVLLSTNNSWADEGGVSFWLPGLYGSLAAVPGQPGFSFVTFNYYDSVHAGADVSRAREIQIGRFNPTLSVNLNANLDAKIDLQWLQPGYTFATPVLGGQAYVGLGGLFGHNRTSLAGTLTASLPPFNFVRSDSISDSVTGFGDLYPIAQLKWNRGVHNFMVYATGDIPVGAYDSARLANLGIGHGAVDGGFGYTYFDQKTGHEFSAVTGLTYNFTNPSTNYQNGVDWHLDWAASQFLSKQFSIGVVGYVYKEIGCDSGSGDRVGCFQSQVVGIGPQLTYLFPVGTWQGYLNLKAYKEFAAENRADGWNAWLTFVISPAAPGEAPPSAKRMITK
jgi:hypothetical protein